MAENGYGRTMVNISRKRYIPSSDHFEKVKIKLIVPFSEVDFKGAAVLVLSFSVAFNTPLD